MSLCVKTMMHYGIRDTKYGKGLKIVLYAVIIHALSMMYFQRLLCLLAFQADFSGDLSQVPSYRPAQGEAQA